MEIFFHSLCSFSALFCSGCSETVVGRLSAARAFVGYHARSRIEARRRCRKAVGEGGVAKDADWQTAGFQCRFSALLTAEIGFDDVLRRQVVLRPHIRLASQSRNTLSLAGTYWREG